MVPSLAKGGGVPSVARFVKQAVLNSGRYELKLVSLCMSSNDPCSLQLTRPSSWRRGVTASKGEWEDMPFIHVGAKFGEFEFQRYRPRAVLAKAVADCDIIQVVCGSPAWANAVVGLGKPVALQVATRARVERRLRDSNAQGVKGWWRKFMTVITDTMDDRALRRVDAIQVENPWMLDYAQRLNIGRKVDLRYAPPGINADIFHPLEQRNLSNSPYILCVGRMKDPRKNIALLLETYALLPEDVRSKVRLVLAGPSVPEFFWKLTETLGVRDRVTFIASPKRDALVRLYQKAGVFALPSDEEGLGVVVLESMACGVPVVATRCGGPDGIITDGEDGFLTPLNDAKAMAGRLTTLLENVALNNGMGRKARKTIEQRYDERTTGAMFVEIWDRLLQKG